MQAIGFAILTVISTAAFTLVLRGTMAVWPVGLGGFLSRIITLTALAAWILATGKGWRRLRLNGLGQHLLLMGVIAIVINLLRFAALKLTTATNVATLFCLDLAFVVLIGAVLRLEHHGWKQLALLPVMLAGMVLLTGALDKGGWGGHVVGDAMAVAAAFAYAVNAFVIRRILRVMDEEAVSFYNHGYTTVGFIALAFIDNEFRTVGAVLPQMTAWLWIVALGFLAAVWLPIYYAALARMAVWKLRAWMLSTPVLVAILEWRLWHVHLSVLQLSGAAIVLGGLGTLIWFESRMHSRGDERVRPAPAVAASKSPTVVEDAAPCLADPP